MAGTIKINPANKGKLRAKAGVKKGQPIPAGELAKLANSKDPKTRKQAQFAENAKKFNH